MAPQAERGQEQGQRPPVQEEDQHPHPGAVEYVDYKDVNLLRRFMSDRAKIRARRVTGNDAQQQATSPWRSRTPARWRCCRTRAGSPSSGAAVSGDRGDRAGRADGPPPRPTAPPPGTGGATTDREAISTASRSTRARVRGGRSLMRVILRADVDGSATRATSSTSPMATPATTCSRGLALTPAPAREAQAQAHAPLRDVKDAADRGAAEEVATSAGLPRSSPSRTRAAVRASCSARSRGGDRRRPSPARPASRSTASRSTSTSPSGWSARTVVPVQAARRRGVPGHRRGRRGP